MNKGNRKYGKSATSSVGESRNNTALTAVALQDHLIRDLALDLSNPLHRPRNVSQTKPKPKPIRSLIDTGRGRTQKPRSKDDVNKEYVLDSVPVKLTLAQKFGLVKAPQQPLSENDWVKVKDKSNRREDFKQPCVICKEDFGTQEQALLSCTHIFHKNCIQAFERFTGKKSCPMCRKEQYQTRIVYEGANYYKHKCATKIQSLWRGYVVRCWYLKLRETNPPNDPKLRKKFYEKRLHDITDRMLRSVDMDVDGFLRDLDQSLEASRDVFRKFDDVTRVITVEDWEAIQLKAVERCDVDCPICLTLLSSHGLVDTALSVHSEEQIQPPLQPSHKGTSKRSYSKLPKQKSLPCPIQKATSRNQPKYNDLPNDTKMRVNDQSVTYKSRKSKVLLSCSHIFHQTCIEAFEEFAVGERINVCPVCRSHYQKQLLPG